jgi:predicted transcriptional regulator
VDSEIDHRLQKIAGKVSAGRKVRRTPRQLLEMFGAYRRGANVVEEIRSRLARHQLDTDPDFNEVHVDEKVDIVTLRDRPLYHEKFEQAEKRLDDGGPPLEVTVRMLLSWFGAGKRGQNVVERVRAALAGFELTTDPDFNAVQIDAEVALVRARPKRAKPPTEPPPISPVIEVAAPNGASESSGLLVGTFNEAHREIHSVKPQTTVREAVTVMLANKVSYLPVMATKHSVKGIIRWKDVAKHFALGGGSASDPVERIARQAEVVDATAPFLKVVPRIIEHGCILVRDEHREVNGIITKKDLGRLLQDLAHPFFILGEIERGLRLLIERGEFTSSELRERALDPSDPRDVESVSDLTLGECARLLQPEDNWARVKVALDRKIFIRRLHEVRQIRNSVMHFSPDDDPARYRETLVAFWELLADINQVEMIR